MSSDNWKKYRLDQIAEIIGGGTPSTTNPDFWGEEIPWVTPRDLASTDERFISRGERCITKKGLQNSSARLLPAGTVLLTTRAPIGYLRIALNPICTNQGFKSLIPKVDIADNQFLFYLLKHNVEYLKSVGVGTTFAEISGSALRQIEFLFPPLPTQCRIAEILSALDDKIELNRQTNTTLEAIAQAIFKEWFVNFNFPGATGEMIESKLGLIPKGWRVEKLGEISKKITKGTTPTTFGDDFVEEGIRFLRVDCIRDESGIDETKALFITSDTNNKLKRSQLEVNDILITIAGSIGRIGIVDERILPANLNQAIGIIRINTKIIPVTYVYYFLKQQSIKEKLLSGVTQSVQANISLNDLSTLEITLPPIMLMEKYDSIVRKNRDQIDNLTEQSAALIGIRDTLLPKLMSGDLEI